MKEQVERLHDIIKEHGADETAKDYLWQMITSCEGQTFETMKGLSFTYRVKGNEIFVDRKERSKSITRSSMDIALEKNAKLVKEGMAGYGPKKLGVFGASYIWGIFMRFGLIPER